MYERGWGSRVSEFGGFGVSEFRGLWLGFRVLGLSLWLKCRVQMAGETTSADES